MDSHDNGSDELTNEAIDKAKKVLNTASKPAKKLAKKASKKVKKSVSNLAKKGLKAVGNGVKTVGTKIITFLFLTPPFIGWILLGLILVIVSGYAIINGLTGDKKENAKEGYEPKYAMTDKNYYELLADWPSRLKTSYYAMNAEFSYYYTLNDDSTLHQGGGIDASQPNDKYNRESQFTLSATFLQYIDTQLNKNVIYPAQFIKPVYNTCSTRETTDGMCKKKDLRIHNNCSSREGDKQCTTEEKENDGKSQVTSSIFSKHNSNEEGHSLDYDVNQEYEYNFKTKQWDLKEMPGMWDWGLAPIIHYKEYEEENYLKNYDINTIKYWNDEEEKYVICKKDECPENFINDVKAVEPEMGKEKSFLVKTKKYLIDHIATFLGTLHTEIEEAEEDTEEDSYRQGSIVRWSEKTKETVFNPSNKIGPSRPYTISSEDEAILKDKTKMKIISFYSEITSKSTIMDETGNVAPISYLDYIKKITGTSCGYISITGDTPGNCKIDYANEGKKYSKQTERKYSEDFWVSVGEHVQDLGSGIIKIGAFKVNTSLIGLLFKVSTGSNLIDTTFLDKGKIYDITEQAISQTENTIQCQDVTIKRKGFAEATDENGNYNDEKLSLEIICNDTGVKMELKNTSKPKTGNEDLGTDETGHKIIAYEVTEIPYLVIGYKENHPTEYEMKGDRWVKEYRYSSDEVKMEDFDSGQYLKDYIADYQIYVPKRYTEYSIDNVINDFKDGINALEKGNLEEEVPKEMHNDVKKYKEVVSILFGNKIITALDNLSVYACEMGFVQDDSVIDCNFEEEEIAESELGEDGFGVKRNYDVRDKMLNLLNQVEYSDIKEELERYAENYGLDKDLFKAMAYASNQFINKTIADENDYHGGGVGLFSIDWSIYKNYTSRMQNSGGYLPVYTPAGNIPLTLTWQAVNDYKYNTLFAAIRMRELLIHYNNNIFMAIQAFNQGEGSIDKAIDEYIELTNSTKTWDEITKDYYDFGWNNYSILSKYPGDPLFLSHVLQYVYKNDIVITTGTKEKPYMQPTTFDLSKIKMTSDDAELSLAQRINWLSNKSIIYNNWNLLYGTDKDGKNVFKMHEFTLDNNRVKYDANDLYQLIGDGNAGTETVNRIIAQYFAAQDGGYVTDYTDITDEMWKEKFNTLFSNFGQGKLALKIPEWALYFPTQPNTPIENVTLIARPYGMSDVKIDSNNRYIYTKNKDILIDAPNGTKVTPVSEGTVTGKDGDCVEILHIPMDENKVKVYTRYCDIKIDNNISIGQEVEKNTTLGTLHVESESATREEQAMEKGITNYDSLDNEAQISALNTTNKDKYIAQLRFSLIYDGEVQDPSWILKLDKFMIDYANREINSGSVIQTNESTKKIQSYIDSHVDELENEFNSSNDLIDENDPKLLRWGYSKQTKILVTGVAWRYSLTSGSFHQGTDAAPYGYRASLYALGKGILFGFTDGYPDTGAGGGGAKNNFGCANGIQMLYKSKQGNWFAITYCHMKQNHEYHLSDYEIGPIIQKGAWLGDCGNSGNSGGWHTHIQVHNLGNGSLRSVWEFYSKHKGTYAMINHNLNERSAGTHCENSGVPKPCWMKPDILFGVKYKETFSGVLDAPPKS